MSANPSSWSSENRTKTCTECKNSTTCSHRALIALTLAVNPACQPTRPTKGQGKHSETTPPGAMLKLCRRSWRLRCRKSYLRQGPIAGGKLLIARFNSTYKRRHLQEPIPGHKRMGLVYDILKESMNMQRECSKPLVLVGFHWYIQGMCIYI